MRNRFVEQTDKVTEIFCPGIFSGICSLVVSLFCGFNKQEEQLERSILTHIAKYMTHSVSLKQFLHFFQLHKSGNFTKFDYGADNVKIYGSPAPPTYPIENIVAPLFINAGACDLLVSKIDLKDLSKALPNVKKFKVFENYNHCDFLFGKDTKRMLFDGIVRTMKKSS